MAKPRGAKYKAAQFYYNDAYRGRMKVLRPDWSTAQRDATLRWMWNHVATQAEKDECERLLKEKSKENTFVADDGRIPDEPKTAADPAPAGIAAAAAAGAATVPVAGTVAAGGAGAGAAVAPVKSRVFSYMPSLKDMCMDLPSFDSGGGDIGMAEKRKLMDAGLCDPEKEPEAKRWHGTHFLGQGATGSCTHWVLVDENQNIDQKLAVRDIGTMHQNHWINPVKWRDQLPIELAILRRLHEQQSYKRNLHRYFGHRIDAWKRRYRVYNEVCDLGDLKTALKYYGRPWRKRHTQHKWQAAHPEIKRARENQFGADEEAVASDVYDTMIEVWRKYMEERDEDPENHKDKEFDSLIDLEQCATEEISEELPEVIPEAFLWQVFDQLVGAALVMQKGATPFVGETKWKEIVHRDIHFGNLFVKPCDEGVYGSDRTADSQRPGDGIARSTKTEYPQVVLADFDTAFFDLQDDDEEYQDNPSHYMCSQSRPDVAARYPPETSWKFQNQNSSDGGLIKLTGATDIWAIGQIMWNLVMNLPYLSAPFFDHESEHTGLRPARRLNNGAPYNKSQLNRFLLTGHKPFEASHQYSPLLRATIRGCLNYLPKDRPNVQALKNLTEKQSRLSMEKAGDTGDLLVKLDGKMEQFRVGRAYMPLPEERGE